MSWFTDALQINGHWQQRFRQGKDQLLTPVARLCQQWHISANTLSWLGLLIGVAGVPVLWFNYWLFVLIELISAFLDVLDGATARLTKTVSTEGKQLDYGIDLTLCLLMCAAIIIWLGQPWLVLGLDVFGLAVLVNWLAGSPLYVVPGRMTVVVFSVFGVPWLGVLIGIPYGLIMMGLLLRRRSRV